MMEADRLSDLLLRWEQLRMQGRTVTAEELCFDAPNLVDELNLRIRAIRSLDAMLGTAMGADEPTSRESDTDQSSQHAATMSTQSKYRVLRSHAKGGLGEVLVAEDEVLGREVALKVIQREHDRDFDRRRRFMQEAVITSRLEHPGIVPVHGIGQDASGRPCYVMRLIRGESLQEAVRRLHAPPNNQRDEIEFVRALRPLLGRFTSICNTVAYAHSHGVIHRDLKPANVMLGDYGETLVVDWGLAKRLEEGSGRLVIGAEFDERPQCATPNPQSPAPNSQPPSALTQHGTALGTPAFMSPEQAAGRSRDVGIASDVFSLGATLYVLLTGKPPFDGRSYGELLNRVQRGDFPKPRMIQRATPKPLEAICLKAMALRPTDRYCTPLDLASDIENWLADQPVVAHRESLVARARRWSRRHRLMVTSAVASFVVAMFSLIVVVILMSRANDRLRIANEHESVAKQQALTHANVANENAALAEQQSELALRSLQSVTFDIQRQLKNVPAAHQVRRRLLDTALQGLAEVAESLEQRPQVNRSLLAAHRDLGDLFIEVGSDSKSGGTEAARNQYQRAFDLAQSMAAAKPSDRDEQRELALCHDRMGDINGRIGTTATAQEHYSRSLAIRERLAATNPDDEQVQRDIAVSRNKLGDLALKGGAVEAAQDHFQQALKIREQQLQRNVSDSELERDLVLSYNKVGQATLRAGHSQQALLLFQKGFEVAGKRAQRLVDDSQAQRDLSVSISYLGNACAVLGRSQEAAAYYGQSLAIDQRRAATDPTNAQAQRDLMQSMEKMSDILTALGKREDALVHVRRMVGICEQLAAADPNDSRAQRDLALAYAGLADLLLEISKHEEAIALYQKSLVIYQQRASNDPSDPRGPMDVALGLTQLGDGLLAAKQVDQALANYIEALKIHRQACEANPADKAALSKLAAYHQRIGVACRRVGKTELAFEHLQQALQIAEKLHLSDSGNVPVQIMVIGFCHSLGLLEASREHYPDAYQWFDKGLNLARQLAAAGKLVGDDSTWVTYLEDTIRECQESERKAKS